MHHRQPPEGDVKLSDFGLGALPRGEEQGRAALLRTTCGTPNYVAPEVLAKRGYRGGPADIWSLGGWAGWVGAEGGPSGKHAGTAAAAAHPCSDLSLPCAALRWPALPCGAGVVLYVVLAGCLPFDEDDLAALFRKISAAAYEVPPWLSADAAGLLAVMLNPDPEARWAGRQGWLGMRGTRAPSGPACRRRGPTALPSPAPQAHGRGAVGPPVDAQRPGATQRAAAGAAAEHCARHGALPWLLHTLALGLAVMHMPARLAGPSPRLFMTVPPPPMPPLPPLQDDMLTGDEVQPVELAGTSRSQSMVGGLRSVDLLARGSRPARRVQPGTLSTLHHRLRPRAPCRAASRSSGGSTPFSC